MNFIRQGLGIALQPELTLKSIAGELCSVPLESTFYRQISLLAKEKPVEGSPLSKPIVESNDTPANSTQFTLGLFSIFKWVT